MTKAKSDTAFLGHPSGLGWLSGSEFWERFSYYGMAGLLVLYMTHQLLNPGHIEHIAGMDLFSRLITRGTMVSPSRKYAIVESR